MYICIQMFIEVTFSSISINPKLIIYSIIILFFGLAQVWVPYIYCNLKEQEICIKTLLTQYGIFFFASSLTASSWWKHSKIKKQVSDLETIGTTIFAFIFIILIVIVYLSGVTYDATQQKHTFMPTHTHKILALSSLCLSFLYGLYTENRTLVAKSSNRKLKK